MEAAQHVYLSTYNPIETSDLLQARKERKLNKQQQLEAISFDKNATLFQDRLTIQNASSIFAYLNEKKGSCYG